MLDTHKGKCNTRNDPLIRLYEEKLILIFKAFSPRLTFDELSRWIRRTQESCQRHQRFRGSRDVRTATLRGNEAQTSLQSCLYHLVSGLFVHFLSTSYVWLLVPVHLLQPLNTFDHVLSLRTTSGSLLPPARYLVLISVFNILISVNNTCYNFFLLNNHAIVFCCRYIERKIE